MRILALSICWVILSLIWSPDSSVQAMDAPQIQQNDLSAKAQTIYDEVFYSSQPTLKDKWQLLQQRINSILSDKDGPAIIAKLTKLMVNHYNQGGYYSSFKRWKGYQSHNLLLARCLYKLTRTSGISLEKREYMQDDPGFINFLTQYRDDELNDLSDQSNGNIKELVQSQIKFLSEKYQHILSGTYESEDDEFEVMHHGDNTQANDLDFQFGLTPQLAFEGIHYLGMLYGAYYRNDKKTAPFYANEITDFDQENGVGRILVTSDKTAMVHTDPTSNTVHIVFGGLGLDENDFGKALRVWTPTPDFQQAHNNSLIFFTGLGGGAHSGFYMRLVATWDEIYRFCKTFATTQGMTPQELNYVIIGHSMGGGEAPLAALRLATLTFNNTPGNHIKVVTFGAPRVFDTILANAYDCILKNHTFMFVHDGDVKVPNNVLPHEAGYRHVGFRINFKEPTVPKQLFHTYPAYKDRVVHLQNNPKTVIDLTLESERGVKTTVFNMCTNLIRAPIHLGFSIFAALSKEENKKLVEFE